MANAQLFKTSDGAAEIGKEGLIVTAFSTDGFLSDEINEWEKDFDQRYGPKIELSMAVNRLAHRLIFSVAIVSNQLDDLLLSTLMARQASTFQGFIILSRKGLIFQAEMLVRALAESMFLVGAICKQPRFAEEWILSDEISRKRLLVRLNQDRSRRGELPDPKAVALIAELEKRIKDEKIKKYNTEHIARLAGLQSYYDTLYGFFSLSVHSSSRSLDKALQADGQGEVTAVEYGPLIEGFDMYFDYAISMTLYVLHEISTHFKHSTAEVESLQQKNNDLAGGTEDAASERV
jgi:hypothetical protein